MALTWPLGQMNLSMLLHIYVYVCKVLCLGLSHGVLVRVRNLASFLGLQETAAFLKTWHKAGAEGRSKRAHRGSHGHDTLEMWSPKAADACKLLRTDSCGFDLRRSKGSQPTRARRGIFADPRPTSARGTGLSCQGSEVLQKHSSLTRTYLGRLDNSQAQALGCVLF